MTTIAGISPHPIYLAGRWVTSPDVLVVELNDQGIYDHGGQLCSLLRARYCDPKIRGINKTDGLTWKVKEIVELVKAKAKK